MNRNNMMVLWLWCWACVKCTVRINCGMINYISSTILPLLYMLLPFILPVIAIPLLMRLFIGRIMLLIVKRKYLPNSLKEIHKGWEKKEDKKAIEAVSSIALNRLKYHFIFSYNIMEDVEDILFNIQSIYNKEKKLDNLVFSFSIRKLIECLLLGFCDIYREYSGHAWFKIVKRIRLVWFWRLVSINKHYKQIFKIPFIEKLRTTRILGKLLRFLLIPILGVPALLWYVLRSVFITIFLEGFIRFLYGLLLMKIGYYAIYLYGRENNAINKRIKQVPKGKLAELSKAVEEQILPKNWEDKSKFYAKAAKEYLSILEKFNLPVDEKVSIQKQKFTEKTKKILSSIVEVTKKAYSKQNPFKKNQFKDKDQIIELYKKIGNAYYKKVKEPILMFRINEILEMGYMGSIILLNAIFVTPGAGALLDKISLDFALKIKDLSKREIIKDSISGIGKSVKYISLFNKARKIFNITRGIVAPYSLAFTFASPIVIQQLQEILRGIIYHRSGRMLLYGWEKNKLHKKDKIEPLLW